MSATEACKCRRLRAPMMKVARSMRFTDLRKRCRTLTAGWLQSSPFYIDYA